MTRILPADKWYAEPGETYKLLPGTHNAINLPDPRNITIIGQPLAVICPQPPYECGVYCDNRLQAENVTLKGLMILRASVNGVNFHNGRGITLDDCWIEDSGSLGVALHNCNRTVLTRCQIIGSKSHATYLSGDGITVANCRIHHNGKCGVHLWTDAPGGFIRNATIIGNNIRNHGRQAIVTRCDDPVVIADNYVDGAMSGIEVLGGGGVVCGNTIRNVSYWHVCVQKCTKPVVMVGGHSKVFDPEGRIQ